MRDAAATLALIVEADVTAAELPGDPIGRADAALEKARAARAYASTQENNWMTLAVEALAKQKALSQFTVDGQPVDGAIYRKWSGFALGQKLVTIANVGKATAQLVTTSSGVPIAHDPAASEGYALERTFYKLDGTKVELKSHGAERAPGGGAEDHRKRGALRQAAGGRPPAGGSRDRQSDAVRQRFDRRLSAG